MKTNVLSLLAIMAATSLLCSGVAQAKDKEHQAHASGHKSLPPGLQKKAAKGQPLPPGWQKRYNKGDILETDIYHRGEVTAPANHDGIITLNVDGQLFKLEEKTRRIIDILTE
ncbi:hypothetical protein [Shewanella sp. YIC-542]|uniref:hypothetical protein n=1 Tax=Shewanella mytili TaxID=3377111 RepID=UPI00398E5AB4